MQVQKIIKRMMRGYVPTEPELAELLLADDFSFMFAAADQVRREQFGDVVHIRGIIEFSNYCRRQCRYCGLNSNNRSIKRYRMTPESIVSTAVQAWRAGYRTVVLQSGEDPWFSRKIIGDIVSDITSRTDLVVTLSCGEFSEADYAYFKEKGAKRYLLKHETADPNIYAAMHPGLSLERRVMCLKTLKKLGYETGSGFMVGLPGQTAKTIAADLMLLAEIGCDMAGIGPFVPHPGTPLKDVPQGSTELVKRAVALARLLLPKCHLPATTALGVVDAHEKKAVFSCGANVIMRKVTPPDVRDLYQIYPSDIGAIKSIKEERKELEDYVYSLGRIPR